MYFIANRAFLFGRCKAQFKQSYFSSDKKLNGKLDAEKFDSITVAM